MTNIEIYRPRSNLIFAGIGVAMSGFFIWSSFYQGGVATETTSTLVAIFILTCIYIFLAHPKITFSDEGIVITNPIDQFTIGWADVLQLDAKWSMLVETKEFTASAWAAPAPGRHRSRDIHITEVKGLGIEIDGSIRPADSPKSDSGAATYRARVRLKKFENSPGATSLRTSKVRHYRPIVIAGASLIAAITVNFFGH